MCVRAEAWARRNRHSALSRREEVCCARRRSRRYPSCCLSRTSPEGRPACGRSTGTDRSRSIVRGSSQGLASGVGVERLAGDVRFLSIARAPSAADASGSGYRTVLLDIKGPPPVRRARPYAPGPPSAIRSRRAVSVRASSRASSTGEGRASRFAVAHGSAPLAAREAQVRRTRMTVSSRRET